MRIETDRQPDAKEGTMSRNPTFQRPRTFSIVVASALATITTIAVLGAVVGLFQSRGLPLGELAAAERACAGYAFESDRQACQRDWPVQARGERVADRSR
jgi:hypothetical protein